MTAYPKGTGIPVRCIADSSVSNTGPEYGYVTDVEGKTYKTVRLGQQTWMAENLRATQFNDGTKIPFTAASLGKKQTPAYTDYTRFNQYYQDQLRPYGMYYNGYTPLQGNHCPLGLHVPTKSDIETLISFLGKNNTAKNLKSKESAYWESGKGNNRPGFNALGAGFFTTDDFDGGQRRNAEWWSSTERDATSVWTMSIGVNDMYLSASSKSYGYPCRCVKD